MSDLSLAEALRHPGHETPEAQADYLDTAFGLFPEDRLEAAGWLGESALRILDGSLEHDLRKAGYNVGIPPSELWQPEIVSAWTDSKEAAAQRSERRDARMQQFGDWLNQRFRSVDGPDAFDMAIAFDQLGVDPAEVSTTDELLADLSLPELEGKKVLVIGDGNSAMLSQDDNVGLAVACLGGETTFAKSMVDPGGLGFPLELLQSELGPRVKHIPVGSMWGLEDRLIVGFEDRRADRPIYSSHYDLIHFGGPHYVLPDTAAFGNRAMVRINAFNSLMRALKPDGMMLLTASAQSKLADSFEELGEERSEEVLGEWQASGIVPIIYPRYGVDPETHRANYR
jgi:hypothetical protein